ncbi:jg27738 [Pararge aegeria aegeria]|uniref:Jg27738 protein n=2 Tax=Pararge aegeria TaxID=116150 RepID=A0A8S4S450_9NEOP|nr:jg27738 [Pararge aegeria aegeria]
MALWTPYAEEALDLTKNKQESPERDRCFRPTVPDLRYSRVSPELEENRYYNYAYEYTVPSSQVSPDESLFYRKVPSPPRSFDSLDVDTLSDDVEYQAFERDALRAMAEKNGGALLGNNPRMRRAVQTSQAADDSYRKQRERNNHAAKQSRDRRKLREVRLAFQVTFLKKKIADLRTRIDEKVCVRCQQQCRC